MKPILKQTKSSLIFNNQNIPNSINSNIDLKNLVKLLAKNNTFNINFKEVSLNNHNYLFSKAADTDMWPMGTHFWLRDNVLIAKSLIESDSKLFPDHKEIGKKILFSCLSVMSSKNQLNRFHNILSDKKDSLDCANWPYIFIGFENINTENSEFWPHKQEAFQMLAFHTLDLIENNLIELKELTEPMKEFLSLVFPFLLKVDFINCENSGSWEEIEAERKSVLAIEIALINKISKNLDTFSFLEKQFNIYYPDLIFNKSLNENFNKALKKINIDFPFESSNYPKDNVKYREADASLIYLLNYDIPKFLSENLKEHPQEYYIKLILEQIERLDTKEKRGIKRYLTDSYQRNNYFSQNTVDKLSEFHSTPSGNFSALASFIQRDKLIDQGQEAAWTHFIWQLASFGFKKYKENKDNFYYEIGFYYFNYGLSLITGPNQTSYTIKDNKSVSKEIKEFLIPECYIVHNDKIIPSPHSPLNWSIAECINAITQYNKILL